MSEKLNPMAFEEHGDVGVWGSGIVSEAEPVSKKQRFDSSEDLRKRFINKHVNKMFTVAELTRLTENEVAA